MEFKRQSDEKFENLQKKKQKFVNFAEK